MASGAGPWRPAATQRWNGWITLQFRLGMCSCIYRFAVRSLYHSANLPRGDSQKRCRWSLEWSRPLLGVHTRAAGAGGAGACAGERELPCVCLWRCFGFRIQMKWWTRMKWKQPHERVNITDEFSAVALTRLTPPSPMGAGELRLTRHCPRRDSIGPPPINFSQIASRRWKWETSRFV